MRVRSTPRGELSPKYDVSREERDAVWYRREGSGEGERATTGMSRGFAARNGDRPLASVSSPGFSADGEKQPSGRA